MMSSKGLEYVYALKCIFNAHAADVRVVTSTFIPFGGLLTGSRDNTAKVWVPDGKSFKEFSTFTGATNFISSLCALPASSQYPNGLLLAGSHDSSIYGFTPGSSEPVLRLLGHAGPVCSLSYGRYGYLVSGSWDKTARVWSGQHCIATLQGHTESVWATAVLPTQDGLLTGSADYTIRLWRGEVCEKVFTGHKDCVRGLATVSNTKFLSCSNDSTVRLWDITGDCLEVFASHTDYIYSIISLNNGMDFASCGEDQNIKIWRNGVCSQTVVIAPKSLWSITCLSTGDLAIGTSDGKVYILERVAPTYFEEMSEKENILAENEKDEIGLSAGSNIRSSIYNGETVVFHEYESNYMYVCEYNHENGTTVKKEELNSKFIEDTFYKRPSGDIDPVSTEKKDFVFDVDVENVMYKLVFNRGENPWEVAMKFVTDHNLPTDHVNQIVDFIFQNTVSAFVNKYFPASNYVTYYKVNVLGLKGKLLEFSTKMKSEYCISPSDIEEVMLLADLPERVTVAQLTSLEKAFSWSDEYLFPVLDLLRLAVKCRSIFEKVAIKDFVNRLLEILKNTSKTVNIILIEKIFCNLFEVDEAEDVLSSCQVKIFECVKEKILVSDISIQKAGCALFLNFAIASYKGFIDLCVDSFCSNVMDIIKHISDSDAIYRILIAIGTSCAHNPLAVGFFRAENVKDVICSFTDSSENRNIKPVVMLLCSEF